MNLTNMRQLSWWEVIEDGDWCVIAGDSGMYMANYSIGWTVQKAFDYYRQAGDTFTFYRPVKGGNE